MKEKLDKLEKLELISNKIDECSMKRGKKKKYWIDYVL